MPLLTHTIGLTTSRHCCRLYHILTHLILTTTCEVGGRLADIKEGVTEADRQLKSGTSEQTVEGSRTLPCFTFGPEQWLPNYLLHNYYTIYLLYALSFYCYISQ